MIVADHATILIIHGITEIGGAERELLTILERLPARGYAPCVVLSGNGPLVEELARRDVPTRSAPFPPWRKLAAYPRRASAVRRLRALLSELNPTLVHVNDIWWVPQTLRARAGSPGSTVPLVAHVRQGIEPRKVRPYELAKADLVLAVSHWVERSLQEGGVSPERIETIHSGLDLGKIRDRGDPVQVRNGLGIPPDATLLGTVANPFPIKGYDVMLRALPAILRACPRCHYVIVGRGDAAYERALRKLSERLGVDGHVHFTGFREEVNPILAALDVYVHPSRMESFGISLIEAMAMGRAVVATRTGGIPEIVVEGETGVLVPPEDPEALAVAVCALLGDTPRRRTFGEAGRRRVNDHFTVEVMMERMTRAYTQLLECRRPARVTGPV